MIRREYSEKFKYVWSKWPKRWDRAKGRYVKKKKPQAADKFEKMPDEDQDFIMSIICLAAGNEGSCPRDLVTWINQQGWEDLDLDEDYEPVLPIEFTKKIKSVPGDTQDFNQQRTILLAKLQANEPKKRVAP